MHVGINDSRKYQVAFGATKNTSYHHSPEKTKVNNASNHKNNQQSFVSSQQASKDPTAATNYHLAGGSTSSTRKTTNTTATGAGTGHSAQQYSFGAVGGIHSLSTSTVQQTIGNQKSHGKRQANSQLITQKGQPDELVNRGASGTANLGAQQNLKTPKSRGTGPNGKSLRRPLDGQYHPSGSNEGQNVPAEYGGHSAAKIKAKGSMQLSSNQATLNSGLPMTHEKREEVSPMKKAALNRAADDARRARRRDPRALAAGVASNTLHRRRKQDDGSGLAEPQRECYGDETDPGQGSFSKAAELLERTAQADLSLSRASQDASPGAPEEGAPPHSGAAPDNANNAAVLSEDDSPIGGPEQLKMERARQRALKDREHRFRKLFKEKFGVSRVPNLPLIDLNKDETTYFKDHYEYQRFLGAGSFGFVVEGTCRQSGERLAIKIVERKYSESIHSLNAEAEILAELRGCPQVIQFKHLKNFQNFVIMGIEFAPGGALCELMAERLERRKHLKDEDCARLVKAILLGLKHCHKSDYVHRDLKPSNVVLADRTDFDSARLVDFGLAVKFETRQGMEESCGTLAYQAPEQMAGGQLYGKAVDIWAVGLIMYELIAAKHPIWTHGLDKVAYKKKALAFQKIEFTSRRFNKFSRNLIDKLCHPKPSLRYTAEQALQHPWITRDFAGGGQIPRTAFEHGEFINEIEDKLRKMMNLMFFVSVVKNHKEVIAEQEKRREKQRQKEQEAQLTINETPVKRPEADFKLQRSSKVLSPVKDIDEGLLRQVTPCFDGLLVGALESSPGKDNIKDTARSDHSERVLVAPDSALDHLVDVNPAGSQVFKQIEKSKRVSDVSDVCSGLMENGIAELLQGDPAGPKATLVRKDSLLPVSDTSQDFKAVSNNGDHSPGADVVRQSKVDEPAMNETLVPKEPAQATLNPSAPVQQRKDQKTQRAFKISKSVSRKAFEASKARKLKHNVSSMDNQEAQTSQACALPASKHPTEKSNHTPVNESSSMNKRRRYVQPVGVNKVELVSKAGTEVKATMTASRGPVIDHSQGKITIPASKVTKASIEQQRSVGQFGPPGLKVDTQSLERQSISTSNNRPACKMPMTQTNMTAVSRVEAGASGHSRRNNGSTSGWSDKRKLKSNKLVMPSPLMNVSPRPMENDLAETITHSQYPPSNKANPVRVSRARDSVSFIPRDLNVNIAPSLHSQTINATSTVHRAGEKINDSDLLKEPSRRQVSFDRQGFVNKNASMLGHMTPKRSAVGDSRNRMNAMASTQSPINRCNTGYVEKWNAGRLELTAGSQTEYYNEDINRLSAKASGLRIHIPTKNDEDQLQMSTEQPFSAPLQFMPQKQERGDVSVDSRQLGTPKSKDLQRVKKRKRDSVIPPGSFSRDASAFKQSSSNNKEPNSGTSRVTSKSGFRGKTKKITTRVFNNAVAQSESRKNEKLLYENVTDVIQEMAKQEDQMNTQRHASIDDDSAAEPTSRPNEVLLLDDEEECNMQQNKAQEHFKDSNLARANSIQRDVAMTRANGEFASLKLRRKLSTQLGDINQTIKVDQMQGAFQAANNQRTFDDKQLHALSGPALQKHMQENLPSLAQNGTNMGTVDSAHMIKMTLSQARRTAKPQHQNDDDQNKKNLAQAFAGGFDIIRHTSQPGVSKGTFPPNVTVLSNQISGLANHNAAIHIYESNGAHIAPNLQGPAGTIFHNVLQAGGTLKRFHLLESTPQARAHTELKNKAGSYASKVSQITSILPNAGQQPSVHATVSSCGFGYATTGQKVDQHGSPQHTQLMKDHVALQRANTFALGMSKLDDFSKASSQDPLSKIETNQFIQLTDQAIRQSLGNAKQMPLHVKLADHNLSASKKKSESSYATFHRDGRPLQYKSSTAHNFDQHMKVQMEQQTMYHSSISSMPVDQQQRRIHQFEDKNSGGHDQKVYDSKNMNVYQQGLPIQIHNLSKQNSSSLTSAQRTALLKQPSLVMMSKTSGQARFSNYTNSFRSDDEPFAHENQLAVLQSYANNNFRNAFNPQQDAVYGQNTTAIPTRVKNKMMQPKSEPRIRDSQVSSNVISNRVQNAHKRHGVSQDRRGTSKNKEGVPIISSQLINHIKSTDLQKQSSITHQGDL